MRTIHIGLSRAQLLIVCLLFVGLQVTGCGDDDTTQPETTVDNPTTSSGWVGFVNWDNATTVNMEAIEVSDTEFKFSPSTLSFEAGKPYILKMKSRATNGEKHYFHAPEFYKAIATRKAQTADAEYKAAYFDDIELLIGGTLDLYFVPVIAGTYDLHCTITGHLEAGMDGSFTITGGDGYELDLEVAADFNSALGSDERRSGSHAVWTTAVTQVVTMTEYAFDPSEYTLTAGQGYILTLAAPDTNEAKHYHTASEFYKTVVTRKAQDSQAEIKVQYFKAVELLTGGTSTELYIVPTVAGTYDLVCTVAGHVEEGMTGTITVE